MSVIGDFIEDDPVQWVVDLSMHVTALRRENESLRSQRDRYRKEAERARVRSAHARKAAA
jgi:hypothetical protein